MKFRKDYEITISADSLNIPFWQARHKGELKNGWDLKDYETMLAMLNTVRTRIMSAINAEREIYLPELEIVREIQVNIGNFNKIERLLKDGIIERYCYDSIRGMSVNMRDSNTTVSNGDWLYMDDEGHWWPMTNERHTKLLNFGKLKIKEL